MKVNVDVQSLCYTKESIRGISVYTIELLQALLKRQVNKYSCSFTDYKKERGHYELVTANIGEEKNKLDAIYECNSMSFKLTMDALENNDISLYQGKSYEEVYGIKADVLFFPHALETPLNISDEKAVVTVHDVMPIMEEYKRLWSKRVNNMFWSALRSIKEKDNIVISADSECSKNNLVKTVGIDPYRIKVVPEGVNSRKYYHQVDNEVMDKYQIDCRYILYLGPIDPRKGIDVLVEAVPLLKEKDVKVVLAGVRQKGYSIDQLINDCTEQQRFIDVGAVSDYEKKILMSMAEVFVFPSFYEGFGLPVLEAMACGTPVITADNSSLLEVGGDAVEFFETGKAESLSEKIDLLLEKKDLRKQYIEKGYERIKRFSWDKTAAQMERLFEECM